MQYKSGVKMYHEPLDKNDPDVKKHMAIGKSVIRHSKSKALKNAIPKYMQSMLAKEHDSSGYHYNTMSERNRIKYESLRDKQNNK